MKMRHFLLVVLFVAGFWYLTSHLPPHMGRSLFGGRGSRTPLQLTEASAAPIFDAEEQNNIAVYKRVLPSVVNITSRQVVFNFFYGVVPQEGQGSGFILDRSGHILTNNHVIDNANRGIQVMLSNKKTYSAQLVGADRVHDLALLKINAPNLEPVVLANSSDLAVGQKVFAIGNPFGLAGTMTRGIISSIRSIRNGDNPPIEDAIQTDAAINPGNSGGPLLNSQGEVIGINTMIATHGAEQSSGVGFAIPVNTAKAVLGDLTRYGRVKRPSLGVVSFPVAPDLAGQMGLGDVSGLLIQEVVPGGAAARAGLRGGTERAYVGNTPITIGGDLIVAIDGHSVANTQDVSAIMDKHQAGDTVSVTILRNRRKETLRLTLGEDRST